MGEIEPATAARVWKQAMATGKASEVEPFAACPPTCEVRPEEHRHYQRAPGVYFKLVEPTLCCGREWARYDELFYFDQCAWCREDGRETPGLIRLIPVVTPLRDKRRSRRGGRR